MRKKLLFIPFFLLLLPFFYFNGFYVTHQNVHYQYNLGHNIKQNNYGVYVINLKNDVQKYKKMQSVLAKENIPFHRIDGIYGKNLSDNEINEFSNSKEFQDYHGMEIKRGTIGCYLSHLKAWKEFLKSDNEFGIIFEDDVRFDPEYAGQIKNIIAGVIKNKQFWDILLFEAAHRGLPLKVKDVNEKLSINLHLLRVSHAGFYIINRKAANALVKNALPMNLNLDHYFVRTWEFDENIKLTTLEPRIAYQDVVNMPSSRLAIDSSKNNNNKTKKTNLVSRSVFGIKTSIALFVRNLKLFVIN